MAAKREKPAKSNLHADLRPGACCGVCNMADARGLVDVELPSGERVVLCGSHDVMRRRFWSEASSLEELRRYLIERRANDRRGGRGEVDELAERLTAAFTKERRVSERRA
jgi:hypothetical protein